MALSTALRTALSTALGMPLGTALGAPLPEGAAAADAAAAAAAPLHIERLPQLPGRSRPGAGAGEVAPPPCRVLCKRASKVS